MTLRRREIAVGLGRRQLPAVHEVELDQELPGATGVLFLVAHSPSLYFKTSIVDTLKYWSYAGDTMSRLRVIPLDDSVVFPGMPMTLSADVGTDDRVILVPRQDGTYAKVGVVAEVAERVRVAGRGFAVSLMGLHRATLGAASAAPAGVLRVDFEERPDVIPAKSLTKDLERE